VGGWVVGWVGGGSLHVNGSCVLVFVNNNIL